MLCVSANKYVRIFGKKIPAYRAKAGLSQESLAAVIGASKGGVYNIERQEIASVYLSKRPKLIEALKISDEEFDRELLVPDGVDNGAEVTRQAIATFDNLLKMLDEKTRAGSSAEEIAALAPIKEATIRSRQQLIEILEGNQPAPGAGAFRPGSGGTKHAP